jgi:hypothetical protein
MALHIWSPRQDGRSGFRCDNCFQVAREPHQYAPCEGIQDVYGPDELTRLRSENMNLRAILAQLVDALKDSRRTLDIAIRAGLDGFTKQQVDDIVQNHVCIRRIDAALAAAEGAG